MPIEINGQTYYRTAEACRTVGISKSTLLRWLRNDLVKESTHRDRRGWRLFTEDDIDRLKEEADQTQ